MHFASALSRRCPTLAHTRGRHEPAMHGETKIRLEYEGQCSFRSGWVSHENLELAHRAADAFNRRDLAAFLALREAT
jgi:hypothetical protein